jgi:hypothetical protein
MRVQKRGMVPAQSASAPQPLPHAELPVGWMTPRHEDVDQEALIQEKKRAHMSKTRLFGPGRQRHEDLHKLLRALANARVVTETALEKSVTLLPGLSEKLNDLQIMADLTALFSALEMLAGQELAAAAAAVADELTGFNMRVSKANTLKKDKAGRTALPTMKAGPLEVEAVIPPTRRTGYDIAQHKVRRSETRE